MSASREKKRRQEQREGGLEPIKRNRSDSGKGRGKIIGIVVGSVLALFAAVIIFYGSGALHKSLPVLTVDGHSVTPAEFNYFFTETKWNVYSMWAQYGMAFDPNLPLKSQDLGGESWADYINEMTVDNVTTLLIQCNEAERAGVALSQEDYELIDTALRNLTEEAASWGMTLQAYLDAYYGRQGLTPEILRRCLERQRLAGRWVTVKTESYTYTDAQLDDYYAENRTEFDRVTYESLTMNGVLAEGDDEQAEAYYQAVKALADELLEKVSSPDSFNALAVEYAARYEELTEEYAPEPEEDDHDHDHDAPLNTRYTLMEYSRITNPEAADWLFALDRSSGDKDSFEQDQSITVYSFIARERDDGALHDVRHILAMFAEGSSREPTEEEREEALRRAEDILQEWRDGEATEESFGELANEHSDDQNGQVTDGGVYTDLTKFTPFVEPFRDWYIDPARRPGETGVVETVYGFHVMYYVRRHEDLTGWREQAGASMTEENFNAYMEQALEAAKISQNALGMFVTNIGK
ncbi:MAG: peptidylprolyl isomerase [Oscillospiraceae bacterium]|nr:peptidylprolyl isomerase [Oscillospiraceae bacterium]